jgi:hypothetical protein
VLARCVHAGDCDASDEAYFAAITETHEVMRCNSPFRGVYAFAGLSTDAFVQWLKAEGAYLGLDVDALPFKLSAVSKVVIYYGPNIDAGDFVGGAYFIPGSITSNGSSLGWRIDWGKPQVSNLYFWPAVGAGGVTIGGWVDLDWSRAAIVLTASSRASRSPGKRSVSRRDDPPFDRSAS